MDLPANLPASYHVLLQKQQEHAGLQALKEASAEMVQRVEKLAEMSSVMADGGESEYFGGRWGGVRRGAWLTSALGQVLQNWPHVFSIINLFGKYPQIRLALAVRLCSEHADRPQETPTSPGGTPQHDEEELAEPVPPLIRLPYGGESASR